MTATADDEPIVLGGREQLFHLLAEASEIEHTLMCTYLYAAFSLRDGEDDGLDARERDAVRRWQRTIMGVAVEEMGHLLLVANLSIAVGARPWFGRPNFPVEPGCFPSGLVVKLAAFDEATLDHFIFVERPRGHGMADGAGFDLPDYQRDEAYDGVMPSMQDYGTIGRLYEAIRANLVDLTRRLGEDALFVGPVDGQVGPDVVQIAGVATVGDLATAAAAIDLIVEQGEGAPAVRERSHFNAFTAIRDELRALRERNPAFRPAFPVATNPVMRRPLVDRDRVFIDDPAATRVLDFGNATYALALRLLVQAFGRRGPEGAMRRDRHLDAAIGLMHVLGRCGRALARLPASPDHPGVHAGMSFTMLRAIEPLFGGKAEDAILDERFSELFGGARVAAQACPALAGVDGTVRAIADAYRAAAEASP
ncbi:MAG TPA: ferritin-like protein [Casimicrobiaceae bacterium]|nr:ferritin-like protein [Casimicrobiaceae bacterium]